MNQPSPISTVEPFVLASAAQVRADRGHLVAHCDGPDDAAVRHAKMRVVFGPANDIGWCDPDNGYDGEEWVFANRAGETFRVYSRWGVFRIGAMRALGDAEVKAFVAWLRSKVSCK